MDAIASEQAFNRLSDKPQNRLLTGYRTKPVRSRFFKAGLCCLAGIPSEQGINREVSARASIGGDRTIDGRLTRRIAFRHGLRASELVDLRWDQIDLEHALLHVRRLKWQPYHAPIDRQGTTRPEAATREQE